ncbi:MAG: hypothetical protein J6R59_00225 [Paludibacteraceae bacterium]|nr:hypothetical protein [Paludibacteraceae bacterium]
MDTIIALSIAVVLAIVALIIGFWYYIFGNSYARAIDQAIKDMEKGITTVITDEKGVSITGTFTVKKYKDEEKS